jgi:hypothetical protein
MPLTLLQMVQRAEAELGLPQSTSVFGPGATDATGTQMGALANRVLDELRRMNRWTAMQFEYNLVVNPPINFTATLPPQSNIIEDIYLPLNQLVTPPPQPNYWQVSGPGIPVAARLQTVDATSYEVATMDMENTNTEVLFGQQCQMQQDTYPVPADFDWFNNRTMWDRTNRWELIGPDSPQLDQWHRSGIVATGPRRHYRKIGPYPNTFRIWPPPAEIVAPLQLVFEYLSINAVAVNGNAADAAPFAQYFVNDLDQPLLDDQAITMGIKWMFWEAKGFGSYVTMQGRWVDYVERLAARDGAAPTLPLVQNVNPLLISPNSVQDGFFPGPTGPNVS